MMGFLSLLQKKEGKSGCSNISYGALEIFAREFYLPNYNSEKNGRRKTLLILLVCF
jgi:hypothetical protein